MDFKGSCQCEDKLPTVSSTEYFYDGAVTTVNLIAAGTVYPISTLFATTPNSYGTDTSQDSNGTITIKTSGLYRISSMLSCPITAGDDTFLYVHQQNQNDENVIVPLSAKALAYTTSPGIYFYSNQTIRPLLKDEIISLKMSANDDNRDVEISSFSVIIELLEAKEVTRPVPLIFNIGK